MFVNNLIETVPYEQYNPVEQQWYGKEYQRLPDDEYEQLRQLLYNTRTLLMDLHLADIPYTVPRANENVVDLQIVRIATDSYTFTTFAGVTNFIQRQTNGRKPHQYLAFYACYYHRSQREYNLRVVPFPANVNELIRRRFRADRMDDIISLTKENN